MTQMAVPLASYVTLIGCKGGSTRPWPKGSGVLP